MWYNGNEQALGETSVWIFRVVDELAPWHSMTTSNLSAQYFYRTNTRINSRTVPSDVSLAQAQASSHEKE